jgi:YD repeat-containing protein
MEGCATRMGTRLSDLTEPWTEFGVGSLVTDTRGGMVYGYTYNSAGRLSALTLVPSGVTIHSVYSAMRRPSELPTERMVTGPAVRERTLWRHIASYV